LNIGVIAGLPISMAGYLLANRLIPADAANRANAEVSTMFWLWVVLRCCSCCDRHDAPGRRVSRSALRRSRQYR
jgi:hypothetical protein